MNKECMYDNSRELKRDFMRDNDREMKTSVKYTEFSQLPLTLTPMDIQEIMGLSRNNTYALCHSKGFPAVRIGKLLRVNRDRFIEWYNTVDEVELNA